MSRKTVILRKKIIQHLKAHDLPDAGGLAEEALHELLPKNIKNEKRYRLMTKLVDKKGNLL